MRKGRTIERVPRPKRDEIEDFGLTIDEVDLSNEIYHRDYYLPEDFPDMKISVGFTDEDIPDFMRRISSNTYCSPHAFFVFMRKYGLLYMQSEFVREHTDDWCYLFFKGEYYGAFKNEIDLDRYASRFKSAYFVTRMYLQNMGGQMLQTTAISQRYTRYVDVNGEQVPIHTNDYFNIDCSITIKEYESGVEITPKSRLIADTGCATSSSLFPDFVSHEYEYCEYPFDENNDPIINEEYRQELLPFINDQIIKRDDITVTLSDGSKIPKMLFIYKDNTFFNLNGTLNVRINSTTFPSMNGEKISFFNSGINVIRNLSVSLERKKPKRPIIPDPLLGMDIFSQIEVCIKPISFDCSSITLKHAEIYESNNPSFRRYDDNINFYEVLKIDENLKLYCKTYRQLDSNLKPKNIQDLSLEGLTFYITKERLAYHSNHGDVFLEVEFKSRLDLVNLMYYRKRNDTEESIDVLSRNGFISNQFQEPYGIEIKLIKYECCSIKQVEQPERSDIKKQDEINVLSDKILYSYRLK